MDKTQLVADLCRIAQKAGEKIMEVYQSSDVGIEVKDDNSPVTQADMVAHNYIVKELSEVSDITIISEEDATQAKIDVNGMFFLVDPLDGTKSFIKRTGEFTVNIGLIYKRKPILGVVYVPVSQTLYYTDDQGKAYRKIGDGEAELIYVRHEVGERGYDVVASQSHRTPETNEFIDGLSKVHSIVPAGSSLKFCLVAEGKADIYPRFGYTMEWDTAAAHAVLLAAGGQLTRVDGSEFLYGKTEQEKPFLNDFFIATAH